VIDLGSIAGLHEHGHQLACCWVRCDRWTLLHLAAMIDAVHGEAAVDPLALALLYGAARNRHRETAARNTMSRIARPMAAQ